MKKLVITELIIGFLMIILLLLFSHLQIIEFEIVKGIFIGSSITLIFVLMIYGLFLNLKKQKTKKDDPFLLFTAFHAVSSYYILGTSILPVPPGEGITLLKKYGLTSCVEHPHKHYWTITISPKMKDIIVKFTLKEALNEFRKKLYNSIEEFKTTGNMPALLVALKREILK